MIASFFASGAFHPDTKFWRSDRKTSQGVLTYWNVYCPECNSVGEATPSSFREGSRSCECGQFRQKEAYIHLILDNETEELIAIKYGISINSKRRAFQQRVGAKCKILTYCVFVFASVVECKQAEQECKKRFPNYVLTRDTLPSGWTETTNPENLEEVFEILINAGGVPMYHLEPENVSLFIKR